MITVITAMMIAASNYCDVQEVTDNYTQSVPIDEYDCIMDYYLCCRPYEDFIDYETLAKTIENPFKWLSRYHSEQAKLTTAHKQSIYWKRIRSRAWKKKHVQPDIELVTAIVIIVNL